MLKIGIAEYDDLRSHGEETYPNESCGILLGYILGRCPRRAVGHPLPQRDGDSPHNRYAIDPDELVHAQRDAREHGLEIVGFYHSHPDHPPQWSSTDLGGALDRLLLRNHEVTDGRAG